MLRSKNYLQLKPSQVAASALILAINLSTSDLAPRLGLKKMQEMNLKSLFFEPDTNVDMADVSINSNNKKASATVSGSEANPTGFA